MAFNASGQLGERAQILGQALDGLPRQPIEDGSPSYDKARLVRLVYDQAKAAGTEKAFLDTFSDHAGGVGGVHGEPGAPSSPAAQAAVHAFADHLVDDLFLPLVAASRSRKAVAERGGDDRATNHVDSAAAHCDALYIFPPSPLTERDEDGDLTPPGQTAADLLGLFGRSALELLEGEAVHAPHNRVVLDEADHAPFCAYRLFLDVEEEGGRPGVVIRVVDPDAPLGCHVPRRVPLRQASAVLLALYTTVARLLHDAGAMRHIDAILADTAVEDVLSDGSTDVVRLMQLRLDGWWDGGKGGREKQEDGIWLSGSRLVEG